MINRGIIACFEHDAVVYANIQEAADDMLLSARDILRAINNKSSIDGVMFKWRNEELRGKHTNKFAKPVIQLDKSGKIVAKYKSVYEAHTKTGIGNIYKCLSGRLRTAGGFIWMYKE